MLDILRVDQTGTVVAYSTINDFITNQGGAALGPPIGDFATARGFFSAAGKFYAVLADGTIVQYSSALDFANDTNGAVIGTVPEYATDVGFLGAIPIPTFAAPALRPASVLALVALLTGAGLVALAFRRRRSRRAA